MSRISKEADKAYMRLWRQRKKSHIRIYNFERRPKQKLTLAQKERKREFMSQWYKRNKERIQGYLIKHYDPDSPLRFVFSELDAIPELNAKRTYNNLMIDTSILDPCDALMAKEEGLL